MRILGAIVFAQSLFVTRGQPEFGFCGCVGAKPIGYQKLRRETLLFEQLSQAPRNGICQPRNGFARSPPHRAGLDRYYIIPRNSDQTINEMTPSARRSPR